MDDAAQEFRRVEGEIERLRTSMRTDWDDDAETEEYKRRIGAWWREAWNEYGRCRGAGVAGFEELHPTPADLLTHLRRTNATAFPVPDRLKPDFEHPDGRPLPTDQDDWTAPFVVGCQLLAEWADTAPALVVDLSPREVAAASAAPPSSFAPDLVDTRILERLEAWKGVARSRQQIKEELELKPISLELDASNIGRRLDRMAEQVPPLVCRVRIQRDGATVDTSDWVLTAEGRELVPRLR